MSLPLCPQWFPTPICQQPAHRPVSVKRRNSDSHCAWRTETHPPQNSESSGFKWLLRGTPPYLLPTTPSDIRAKVALSTQKRLWS